MKSTHFSIKLCVLLQQFEYLSLSEAAVATGLALEDNVEHISTDMNTVHYINYKETDRIDLHRPSN